MDKEYTELDKVQQKYKNSNFLQSSFWAKKNRLENTSVIIKTFDKDSAFLGIIRDAKRGKYLEIPAGPLVDWTNKQKVETVFDNIKSVGKENHCVFIRFRPQLEDTEGNQKLLKLSLKTFSPRPAQMHLAAQNTVILDLKKSEDELLMSFRRQTRYEVRRSEKQGIIVEESNSNQALKDFHKLQKETAKRQNFIPPNPEELEAEKKAFGEYFHLFCAKLPETDDSSCNSTPLCYGLFLSDGREAAYYEAASSELARKYPGAYALIWHAIKFFKQSGVERLNLWGIAPPGVENHRYSGVTTFKTGFGGEILNYIPAQDIILDPLRYKFTEIIETARKHKRHL